MATEFFRTTAGGRIPAVTAAQMAEIDRIALDETGPNLFQMMENAGRNLAMAVLERLGTHRKDVIVLAGTGNNGGGGICAARHLANRGVAVTLVMSDATLLGDVASQQLAVYRQTPGKEAAPADVDQVAGHLVIDALIGYRLDGPARGSVAHIMGAVDTTDAFVIALDVPSGLDATTGEPTGPFIPADLTVTVALPKSGLDAPGCGLIELSDIGIPSEVYRRAGIAVPAGSFGMGYRIRITPEPPVLA